MTKSIEELLKRDSSNKYKYQVLDRMRSDCEYYLNAGGRHNKFLWSGSVKEHIEDMTALYLSFSEEERPEWLTLEQIKAYGEKMKEGEINDSNRYNMPTAHKEPDIMTPQQREQFEKHIFNLRDYAGRVEHMEKLLYGNKDLSTMIWDEVGELEGLINNLEGSTEQGQ